MANIITYPLYYTPYCSPSSGIANLEGFIFHTTTSGDAYYFPLPLIGLSDIPLNIGKNVLDIWYDGCYILVCTDSGVECLNSRTLGSIWYFGSTAVRAVCSNQTIVCFGTTCSGIYVDILITSSGLNLEVTCQLTCSGVNSVAYSTDTGMYYWSTASKAYCADTCV
jgi:hypothetical protein